VLRISCGTEGDRPAVLRVEGEIAGEWVRLLEQECRRRLDTRQAVELDLGEVGFVDRVGVAMLRGLMARGVRVTRASALVSVLLEPGTGA
jgi:anti-anti-sigma regulatory factor